MFAHLFAHVAKHLIVHALTPKRTAPQRRQRAPKVNVFWEVNALTGSKLPPPLPASALVRPARVARPRRAKRVQVQVVRGWEC